MNYLKTNQEFVLHVWNLCQNHCTFCYNQGLFHMPMNIKQHMQTCKDILTSSFLDEFDRVRFIGGEIFDKSIEILGV